MKKYDVAILGGGPGGYETAIRCSWFGLKTALIEKDKLGGTCLNRGCIPMKALLHCAEAYRNALEASCLGVDTGEITFDFKRMMKFRDGIVQKLQGGIGFLEKAHKVDVIKGLGTLMAPHTIQAGEQTLEADHIILAMGSAPAKLPIPGFEYALTSDDVLKLEECPDRIVIIGGGVIGIEFATLFSSLGSEVTVLEMMPEILTSLDPDIRKLLITSLKRRKVRIVNGARVTEISKNGENTVVAYEYQNEACTAEGDCCIVSIGRTPQTFGIGLEQLGIAMNRGFVEVDEQMRTSVKHIYAIGDITGRIQLAHVASAQGMVAASNCAGKEERMSYDIVPACIYTAPEIAYVGMTESQAGEKGIKVKTGTFSVAGNGKSLIMGVSEGLAKIVVDAGTGALLGAQILAPRATDMIAEIAAIIKCEGTVEELANTIHPHPTVSEILMEAGHDVSGQSCNAAPKKR